MTPNLMSTRIPRLALRRRPTAARLLADSTPGQGFDLLALNVVVALEELDERTLAVFIPREARGGSRVSLNLGLALAQHVDVTLLGTRWREGEVMWPPAGPERPDRRLLVRPSRLALPAGPNASTDLEPLAQVAESGRYVVLHASQAERSNDAYLIAQRARNAIYVLPARTKELEPHQRQIAQLRRLNVNLLGVVVDES